MAARARQLSLLFKQTHGGRRIGAGRRNRSGLQAHVRRPCLNRREPVHVTLKLREDLPSLHRKDVFRCLRGAVRKARTKGFSVTHFAILSNHIHLILEPNSADLGRVFQSLCISFAKRLNEKLGRKGAVFKERYHVHVLRTPAETRNALSYVLTNEARHRERGTRVNPEMRNRVKASEWNVRIDPFSSAFAFRDWKKLLGASVNFEFSSWSEDWIEAWYDEILAPARTWLLKQGWLQARQVNHARN
jgi:REP element-mobilizing transposase RayT